MTKPIDKVLDALRAYGIQRSGDSGKQWMALCPAHDDHDRSLAVSIGRNERAVMLCYKGCSVEAIVAKVGLTMADLRLVNDDAPTLAELASAKGLPVSWLIDKCGLRDLDDGGVGIPYQDETGRRLLMRRRVKLSGKNHTMQPKGIGLQAYGQWRKKGCLAAKVGEVVIVEGESDCWTLWHVGIEARGLPGATAAKCLTAELLEGFTSVYVWQEPGEGGETFAGKAAAKLKKLGLLAAAKLIRGEAVGAKDPNSLFLTDREGFGEKMREVMAGAGAMPEPAKVGKKMHVPGSVAVAPPPEAPSGGEEPLPAPAPGYYGMTDLGNARRLVHRHGRNVRWVKPWKSWIAWDGCRWREDADGAVVRYACDTVQSIYGEAASATDPNLRQQLAQHAVASESARSIEAMIRLARSQVGVELNDTESLNSDRWLFNCPNGTVDLKTGMLRAFRREDMMTQQCVTAFDPEALCPDWEEFLAQIFSGNHRLIGYVQRLAGYALSGSVSRHRLPVLWGSGANGKGTLLNALYKVIGGDYACAASPSLLTMRRDDQHPTELARLYGKRFVVCQETGQGVRLNEPLIKRLTSSDPMPARRLYENLWDFIPTHKIFLSTNHKPKIKGTDWGIWRRVKLIPFVASFRDGREREGLEDYFARNEAVGILAWAVRGCLEWQKGERIPDEVNVATQEYQQEEDVVGKFLEEACLTASESQDVADQKTQASELYDAYRRWSESCGERALNRNDFAARMKSLGHESKKSVGVMKYVGLILRPAQQKREAEDAHYKNGKCFSLEDLDD